jgi:hypothetical protein
VSAERPVVPFDSGRTTPVGDPCIDLQTGIPFIGRQVLRWPDGRVDSRALTRYDPPASPLNFYEVPVRYAVIH